MWLLTYSSVGIAAAPPTSSAEAIHHRVFRPLARYTLRMGVRSDDKSLRVGGGFPATFVLVFLFFQIQQDDCSAAWPILCAVVLLHRPVTPSNAENNLQTDCAGNPLHPTSTGKLQVCQPLPLHSVSNSSYLALFRSFASPHTSLPRRQSTR